ncbi:hypothetical protein [Actinomadura parmotrematis]|uniref:ApeA N-terminal domain-containing protein n=1 Tax=Actinomadura parmotrematis TaxID=2864039 RepID=A0ABS7FQ78_9ACTN|nr:hypothetical protein [Actinomadura parmotrematis]MBW8482526.1 hypothetical protein [Actinomadura parmotrematis]
MRIEGREFLGVKIVGSMHCYENVEIVNSKLISCALAQFDDPEYRLTVRGASVRECMVSGGSIQGVHVEDSLIENVNGGSVFYAHGCVFDRVVIRGAIGAIMAIMPNSSLAARDLHVARMIELYRQVEWALDISAAEFVDVDLCGVPGHLVKIDPETQIILHRDRFDNISVHDLPPLVQVWLGRFRATPFDSIVAVAPKLSENFLRYLDGIRWLRDNGLGI